MINALLTQLPVGPSNLKHNALLLPHQSKLDDSRQIGSRQRWSTVSYMGISNLEFHVLGSAFCSGLCKRMNNHGAQNIPRWSGFPVPKTNLIGHLVRRLVPISSRLASSRQVPTLCIQKTFGQPWNEQVLAHHHFPTFWAFNRPLSTVSRAPVNWAMRGRQ